MTFLACLLLVLIACSTLYTVGALSLISSTNFLSLKVSRDSESVFDKMLGCFLLVRCCVSCSTIFVRLTSKHVLKVSECTIPFMALCRWPSAISLMILLVDADPISLTIVRLGYLMCTY